MKLNGSALSRLHTVGDFVITVKLSAQDCSISQWEAFVDDISTC